MSSRVSIFSLCKPKLINVISNFFAVSVTTQPGNESELQLYRVLQRANLLTYFDTFIAQGKAFISFIILIIFLRIILYSTFVRKSKINQLFSLQEGMTFINFAKQERQSFQKSWPWLGWQVNLFMSEGFKKPFRNGYKIQVGYF